MTRESLVDHNRMHKCSQIVHLTLESTWLLSVNNQFQGGQYRSKLVEIISELEFH